MRAALVVHRIAPDTDSNLASILDWTTQAADAGADLVLFAEAALTGLINDDNASHDLPLGQRIPGPVTDRLARLAGERGIWLALGLLESDSSELYDTALLFTPKGDIGLKYRRIQPQWHGRNADPEVYRQGSEIPALDTPLGCFAFLICGDLFDDSIVERVRALRPDWLLFPFARCFSDGSCDQRRWEREEQPEYVHRVQLTGATALMVNHIAAPELLGGAFGGAMVVANDGRVIDRLPLGTEGTLLIDLSEMSARDPRNLVSTSFPG
jgi:predicted amidohydrolase